MDDVTYIQEFKVDYILFINMNLIDTFRDVPQYS